MSKKKAKDIYIVTKDLFDKYWEADTALYKKSNNNTIISIAILGSLFGFLATSGEISFPALNIFDYTIPLLYLFIFGTISILLSFLFSLDIFIKAGVRIPYIEGDWISSVKNTDKLLINASEIYAKGISDLDKKNKKRMRCLVLSNRTLIMGILLIIAPFLVKYVGAFFGIIIVAYIIIILISMLEVLV